MNKCKLCGKKVEYPDGIYLRKGKIVHVECLRLKRQAIIEPKE